MSVVVAIKSADGRVCMAADSQVSSNGGKTPSPGVKNGRFGDLLWGVSGQVALCSVVAQISRADFDAGDLAEWVRSYFFPTLRKACADYGCIEKHEGFEGMPGEVLLARGAGIVKVDMLGGVVPMPKFAAIGSGCCEARGAMHGMLRVLDFGTEAIARYAVEAACDLDDGCSPPVVVEWTNPNPKQEA